MVFPRSLWHTGAIAGLMALLSLGVACNKGSDDAPATTKTVTVSGTLKYTRIPLVSDATTGIPTGLESNSTLFTSKAARGVTMRVYQYIESENYSGETYSAWVGQGQTVTDSEGKYSFKLAAGYKTFVEVTSQGIYYSSDGARDGQLKIFAEPGGIDDPTLEPNRLMYVLRKGPDGSSQTDPMVLPGALLEADKTIDFTVGLSDPWWLSPVKEIWTEQLLQQNSDRIHKEGADYAPNPTNPGTGSRVLAILDSTYSFAKLYGNPSPSGFALDLNYFYDCRVGQHQTTSLDYDLATYPSRRPQAYDGSAYHYFGTIQGGNQNDDAFDEAVLFPILGRNNLLFDGGISLMPTAAHLPGDADYLKDLQDLRPDLAMVEGLAPAMAAALLKSPYLADTTGQPGGGLNPIYPYRDIRNLTGIKKDAFSAPSLSALAWEIILKSNALTSSSPVTDWTKIDEWATARLFFITSAYSATSGRIDNIPSIYHQVSRLQEDMVSGETVDLQDIFTDEALTSLLAPFNIPWPKPTSYTAPNSPYLSFMPFWQTDPDSLIKPLPTLTLSMAYARPDRDGKYPGVSWGMDDPMHPTLVKGEVFTGIFNLTQDTAYDLSLNTSPAIPASATIQVSLGIANTTGAPSFFSGNTYSFGASSPAQHYRINLGMAGIGVNNRGYFPILVRLVSPDVLQPSDIAVTVNLVPIR